MPKSLRAKLDAPLAEVAVDEGEQVDVLTAVVQRGIAGGKSKQKVLTSDLREARQVAIGVHRPANVPAAIDNLLRFVETYPNDERFQALVARVMERYADQRVVTVWRGIDERFPSSRDAFIRLLRWTRRLHGPKAAAALRDTRFGTDFADADSDRSLRYGRACLELQEYAEAEEAFDRILSDEHATQGVLIQLAGVYKNQRQPLRAHSVIETARNRFGETPAIRTFSDKLEGDLLAVKHSLPDLDLASGVLHDAIISRIFSLELDQRLHRSRPQQRSENFIGSIALLNAGLGAGGAERQFVNTAIGLQRAATGGTPIGGIDILGPVQVICRSLHSRTQGDFFVPMLRENGLDVHEYSSFPEYGGRPRHSTIRSYVDLLDYVPAQMRDGLVRLTDFFRYTEPDVVHIWQDGAILATGLAAVLAGVPKILLGVRSLPPIDRPERYRPEYEIFYRSILGVPGVSLVANSRMAANRYASWLNVPSASVHVIPNGVSPLPASADAATVALASKFDARRPPGVTLGSVMRFDENKRPLLWLDVAAEIARRDQGARFILVGDGPLFSAAQIHAQSLGIADRVLFVGRSPYVGYWLTRLAALEELWHGDSPVPSPHLPSHHRHWRRLRRKIQATTMATTERRHHCLTWSALP